MTENSRGPLILIVEDDPSLSKMYSTKFSSNGFQVIVAHDGAEGLAVAARTPNLNAILLDMMLPKYSGLEILEQLKERNVATNVPIVVLSNKTELKEKEKALKLGAKEYLAKAMHTPDEVMKTINKYLVQAQIPKTEATQS